MNAQNKYKQNPSNRKSHYSVVTDNLGQCNTNDCTMCLKRRKTKL